MLTALGWSIGQYRSLTLPRLWELFEYWNQYPPAHILLRGYTGYKPSGDCVRPESPGQAEQMFLQSLEPTVVPFDRLPLDVQAWLKGRSAGQRS